MIDFHTHILHDIDDGATSLQEALGMARMAVDDGITTIVATPHSRESTAGERYTVDLVQARLHELRAALAQADIALVLEPGTEIRYHAGILHHLQAGLVLPCGSARAILLELPGSGISPPVEQSIFELQLASYRIILAHPERIASVQRDPNLLIPLIERGVLMQLTASALLGTLGKRMREVAETLLTHGMIHLLSSDAHGMPPRRPPLLTEARRQAATLIGEAATTALVQDIPAALLSGQPLDLPPPDPVPRTRRWFW